MRQGERDRHSSPRRCTDEAGWNGRDERDRREVADERDGETTPPPGPKLARNGRRTRSAGGERPCVAWVPTSSGGRCDRRRRCRRTLLLALGTTLSVSASSVAGPGGGGRSDGTRRRWPSGVSNLTCGSGVRLAVVHARGAFPAERGDLAVGQHRSDRPDGGLVRADARDPVTDPCPSRRGFRRAAGVDELRPSSTAAEKTPPWPQPSPQAAGRTPGGVAQAQPGDPCRPRSAMPYRKAGAPARAGDGRRAAAAATRRRPE